MLTIYKWSEMLTFSTQEVSRVRACVHCDMIETKLGIQGGHTELRYVQCECQWWLLFVTVGESKQENKNDFRE